MSTQFLTQIFNYVVIDIAFNRRKILTSFRKKALQSWEEAIVVAIVVWRIKIIKDLSLIHVTFI